MRGRHGESGGDRGPIEMRGHQKPPSPNARQLSGLGTTQSVRGCRCSGSAGEEVGQHGNRWKRGVGIIAGRTAKHCE
jgi:hypothetical protein